MGGQWANGQYLTAGQYLPDASWGDYIQWFLGRRQRFVVRENSMLPTLMPGDTVLAELGSAVTVGDIALVHWGGLQKTSETTDAPSNRDVASRSAPAILLVKRVSEIFYDGSVYLISDNANEPNARDSRHFGVIESRQVIGRVTSRLASLPE